MGELGISSSHDVLAVTSTSNRFAALAALSQDNLDCNITSSPVSPMQQSVSVLINNQLSPHDHLRDDPAPAPPSPLGSPFEAIIHDLSTHEHSSPISATHQCTSDMTPVLPLYDPAMQPTSSTVEQFYSDAYTNLQTYLQSTVRPSGAATVIPTDGSVFKPTSPPTINPTLQFPKSPYSHIRPPAHLMLFEPSPNADAPADPPKVAHTSSLKTPNRRKGKNQKKFAIEGYDELLSSDDLDDGVEYSMEQTAPIQTKKYLALASTPRVTRLSATKPKPFSLKL